MIDPVEQERKTQTRESVYQIYGAMKQPGATKPIEPPDNPFLCDLFAVQIIAAILYLAFVVGLVF